MVRLFCYDQPVIANEERVWQSLHDRYRCYYRIEIATLRSQ
jgi:hypothetical protein